MPIRHKLPDPNVFVPPVGWHIVDGALVKIEDAVKLPADVEPADEAAERELREANDGEF